MVTLTPLKLTGNPVQTASADEVAFTEQLYDLYLTQLNNLSTRGNNILDLVISSVANQVGNITTLDPTRSRLFTDHAPIIFHLKTSINATTKLTRAVLDYRRGNLDVLRTAYDAIDFTSSVQSNNDISTSWQNWKDTVLNVVKDYIPTKRSNAGTHLRG